MLNRSGGIDTRVVLAIAALLMSARFVLHASMPPRRRKGAHRRKPGSPRIRASRGMPRGLSEPAPIAGAAAGLLESIPFLEPAHTGRLKGATRLVLTIAFVSALFAAALYFAGRAITLWAQSLEGL